MPADRPHTHSHSHGAGLERLDDAVPATTRRTLAVLVGVCAIATVSAIGLLWPDDNHTVLEGDVFGARVDATVAAVEVGDCSFSSPEAPATCEVVVADVTSGAPDGESARLEQPLDDSTGVQLKTGDKVVLNYAADAPPEARFQFADYQRGAPLTWLVLIFAVAVIALGRLRGLLALMGLGLSLVVLVGFMLPALLDGKSPLGVALAGASAVALIALYLAHGINVRTTVALLGTFASLAITGILGALFVGATRLTGLTGEEVGFLRAFSGALDFKGLLLAGIIIGALGVLDDVTVTQVSAVWELNASNPNMSVQALYRAAIRIGRDHIASTVNTLVLAYAGASLPLLLLFTQAGQPLSAVLTGETVAIEIVRTLVGSIGLVASVPITTLLAVLVTKGHVRGLWSRPLPQPRRILPERDRADRTATWDDFGPADGSW